MYFFKGGGVFSDGDSERGEANGASIEFVDHGFENSFIHFIESVFVDFDHFERGRGGRFGDFSVGFDLGEVAGPAEKVVGNSWGAARSGGDGEGSVVVDLEV